MYIYMPVGTTGTASKALYW